MMFNFICLCDERFKVMEWQSRAWVWYIVWHTSGDVRESMTMAVVLGEGESLLWWGGEEENIYCGGVVMMEEAFTMVLVTW